MKIHIILLRGINVSGKNKIQMVALRQLLNELNFQNVQTYIQSGNIVLDSEEDIIRTILVKNDINLETLHQTITKSFNFEGFEMASFGKRCRPCHRDPNMGQRPAPCWCANGSLW